MTEFSKETSVDDIDRMILNILQENGRISNADLARQTELSPPAIHARIKRLESQGFITRYVAILDRQAMGYDMLCLISVTLQIHQPEKVNGFRNAIRDMPEVQECYHITGEYDYVLKVAIRNRQDLERFLMERLTPIPGIAKIHTGLVLNDIKSTTRLPID